MEILYNYSGLLSRYSTGQRPEPSRKLAATASVPLDLDALTHSAGTPAAWHGSSSDEPLRTAPTKSAPSR